MTASFRIGALCSWLLCAALVARGAAAQQPADAPEQRAPADAGPAEDVPAADALPPERLPRLTLSLSPESGLSTGDILTVTVTADAVAGDHVTVVDQSFAPFEISDKRTRDEPGEDGRTRFAFELELLALSPGEHELSPIELRVVTSEGVVADVETEPRPVSVASLLANEPNAEPKPPTEPVVVMQEDLTPLYIIYGVLGALLIALLTWLATRWWQRREKPAPPPRPPWEIAMEQLGRLRREKAQMVEQSKGVEFVDQVSDVVRQYLGGRFGFDGLECTTDEMVKALRDHSASVGLLQEVAAYLNRCDLVKFAKVVPDADEVDLILEKAQDIVQFSLPVSGQREPAGPPSRPSDPIERRAP